MTDLRLLDLSFKDAGGGVGGITSSSSSSLLRSCRAEKDDGTLSSEFGDFSFLEDGSDLKDYDMMKVIVTLQFHQGQKIHHNYS